MIKILVVGDPGVGKSTLINQISENISASPLSEEKNLSNKFRLCRAFNTRFGLFEVSTLEGHPEDVLVHQKNVDGILFVYENACSFADLSEWIQTSKNLLPLTIPRFLVFNKKSFVKNMDFQETSSTLHSFEVNAQDKIEVQFVFGKLLQEINKNTDEEMAKSKSDNERLFQEKIFKEILAISKFIFSILFDKVLEKENKEITEKMNKITNENILTEFQSQAKKVLEEFRTEGKSLIKETQEFLVQLQSYSKEKTQRMKSATSMELQNTAQLPSILLNKSKSVQQINELEKENITPNRQPDMKEEIRLIWDTINTIIGNTHDHLEKIRHEINRINNHHIKTKKIFLENEMPHIITKIKDQIHNYLIRVQKEFEDKIITLEDNFLNNSNKFQKKTLEEEEEDFHPVENLEEMIQSFQSPFLRMRKDEFAEKIKPKRSDLEVLKEESLPSLWATLDLVAIRLNRLEHKITC